MMFSSNIVGTANATTAGWGNLGGGVTNVLMPQFYNLMKAFGLDDNKAWRVAMVIPGSTLLGLAFLMFFTSDDGPDGQYQEMYRKGTKEKTNPFVAMARAAGNFRSWLLFWNYACCFGVELAMNGNLATYFQERFELDQGKAGLIAGLFGLMNLFARSLGGITSDLLAKRWGMRGRLWNFALCLIFEGLFLVVFSRIGALPGAIVTLILFSTFVQMSEGATFGIVPFVDPIATGAVSGIVGAGGNVGGVIWNQLFKIGYPNGMLALGCIVVGSGLFVTPLIHWPHYGSMLLPASAALKDDDEDEEYEEEEEDGTDGDEEETEDAGKEALPVN
uniref:Major facilitator superfamily (MFS) profile domain-containing protein n=1 Tax=Compsopogon caeruleus TaxID=31354 RepID=A0A7S1XC40_9RHOD|mmetsp:Transcript_15146/g.30795  ORF Transcript_15146/g.30795 Transcript_15146/m.30795 type:complete len:332 (+) Transcript_15146:1-996(+)